MGVSYMFNSVLDIVVFLIFIFLSFLILKTQTSFFNKILDIAALFVVIYGVAIIFEFLTS